nr:hypothetical protein [Tanacetum cinerariifolium]
MIVYEDVNTLSEVSAVVYDVENPIIDDEPVVVDDKEVFVVNEAEDIHEVMRSTWQSPMEKVQTEFVFLVREKPLAGSRFVGQRKFTAKVNPEVCKTRTFALGDKPHSFFTPEGKPPRRGLNPRPLACGARSLSVSNPKKHETLESTWKKITDGRYIPLNRHLKKSETFENHNQHEPKLDYNEMKKLETFNDRIDRVLANRKLRKEGSPSQDELNRRVEAFIKKFYDDLRLQRQESLQQYMDIMNRDSISYLVTFQYISWYQDPKFLIKMFLRRSEGEELEYQFFEGDGSSFDKWRDYGMAGDDYEGPLMFDDDQFKDELEMGDDAFVLIGKEVALNSKIPEAMFPLLEEFSDVFHDEPHYRLRPGEHEELRRQVEEFISKGHIRKIMSTCAQPRGPLDLLSLYVSGSVPKKVQDFVEGFPYHGDSSDDDLVGNSRPHYRLRPGEHEELRRQVEEFIFKGHIHKIMSTCAQPCGPLDLLSLHVSGSVPKKVQDFVEGFPYHGDSSDDDLVVNSRTNFFYP